MAMSSRRKGGFPHIYINCALTGPAIGEPLDIKFSTALLRSDLSDASADWLVASFWECVAGGNAKANPTD